MSGTHEPGTSHYELLRAIACDAVLRRASTALERAGYTIDRRKVNLEEPIKSLGDYKVTVKLHREVSVELPVHVIKEE